MLDLKVMVVMAILAIAALVGARDYSRRYPIISSRRLRRRVKSLGRLGAVLLFLSPLSLFLLNFESTFERILFCVVLSLIVWCFALGVLVLLSLAKRVFKTSADEEALETKITTQSAEKKVPDQSVVDVLDSASYQPVRNVVDRKIARSTKNKQNDSVRAEIASLLTGLPATQAVAPSSVEGQIIDSDSADSKNSDEEDVPQVAGEITMSAEHELELELATAHINPNLTDFDQSIAEAEFQESVLPNEDFEGVAQPTTEGHGRPGNDWADLLDVSDKENAESAEFTAELDQDIQLERSITRSLDSDTDVNLRASEADLAELIQRQDENIQALKHQNSVISAEKELLERDVNQLQQRVKSSHTLVRKSIAEKEQAIEVKNRALAIATMERKKRKLIQIRAKKALLQMQRSMQLESPEAVD
ncbi:MAG: hypothetical protein KTR35_05185 [Gammaproteobacteria bacterium]|nr:hypothetical protein [Gammaproteobacteria bacterium]